MTKFNKIRWREDDKKELARLAKNFNAKIEYQLKKNPELKDVLPEKVKVKDLVGNEEKVTIAKNLCSRNLNS